MWKLSIYIICPIGSESFKFKVFFSHGLCLVYGGCGKCADEFGRAGIVIVNVYGEEFPRENQIHSHSSHPEYLIGKQDMR